METALIIAGVIYMTMIITHGLTYRSKELPREMIHRVIQTQYKIEKYRCEFIITREMQMRYPVHYVQNIIDREIEQACIVLARKMMNDKIFTIHTREDYNSYGATIYTVSVRVLPPID